MAFASRHLLDGDPPEFFWGILDWFGIPRDDTRMVSDPTLVPRLFVLPQAEQPMGPGPAPDTLDALDDIVGQRLGGLTQTGVVYVSRASEKRARFAGEEYLELAFSAAGVKVIRPETLPLAEQLRVYASATTLIFAEGSAIHGAQLLGRSLGDVVIVMRRPWIQPEDNPFRPNVEPRARSLTGVNAVIGLIHPLRPWGGPAIERCLTLLDPEALLGALAEFVPDLHLHLDPEAYRRAQHEDVFRWVAALPAKLKSPESIQHLMKTITSAGLTIPGDA